MLSSTNTQAHVPFHTPVHRGSQNHILTTTRGSASRSRPPHLELPPHSIPAQVPTLPHLGLPLRSAASRAAPIPKPPQQHGINTPPALPPPQHACTSSTLPISWQLPQPSPDPAGPLCEPAGVVMRAACRGPCASARAASGCCDRAVGVLK